MIVNTYHVIKLDGKPIVICQGWREARHEHKRLAVKYGQDRVTLETERA